jgi:2-polyprenyl-3-methyl-5-hydroxy-6-metoxy-1,4-benzoquinol methylase
MQKYLKTIYFRDEYGCEDYPQKLCDYLTGDLTIAYHTLLDVGSGKGNHLVAFDRLGFDVTGLDSKKECVDILKDFNIVECNIETESFPFEDNSFDVVFSKSVLEHVANADNFLQEVYRVVRPGGRAILMTPDWDSNHRTFWDDYTHVKAWTRKSLQNAMLIHGFEDVECSYFRQLPVLWRHPALKIVCDFVAYFFPNSWKWKNTAESKFRPFIRFSKEKMLLGTATK